MGLIDTLQNTKEKVKRKTKSKKADKRAKSRRIENRDPEGLFESATVAGKEAQELGGAVKELGSEATPESTGKAGSVLSGIGEGAGNVVEGGNQGNLDVFDSDMDGGSTDGEMFPFDEGGTTLEDDLDTGLDDF